MPLGANSLLANATDGNGDSLTVTAFTVPGTGAGTVGTPLAIAGVGSLTINSDGSYSFTPEPNYTGSIPVVTYTVSDSGGLTDTSTLTLTMVPVNDPPVDPDDSNTVTEDTPLTVDAANGLLNGATDPEGDPLTVTGFTVPGIPGTQTPGTPVSIPGVGDVTINPDGSYSFTPEPGYDGVIPVITYTVSDGQGGEDTSTLALTMVPVNDPPVDGDETNTVTEDTTLSVAAAPTACWPTPPIQKATPLTITGFTVPGVTGTQTVGTPVAITGVGSVTINADGSYSFTPGPTTPARSP